MTETERHAHRTALRKELTRLWDLAVSEFKVPVTKAEAFRAQSIGKIRQLGNGDITPAGIAWLREKLQEMPQVDEDGRPVSARNMALAGTPADPQVFEEPKKPRRLKPLPPWRPGKADWSVWGLVVKCDLWKAVVLSLGFDPVSFVPTGDRLGTHPLPREAALGTPPHAALTLMGPRDRKGIEGRLTIAASNLDVPGGIRAFDHAADKSLTSIMLPDFGSWADRTGLPIPKPFPRETTQSHTERRWPWGKYETKLLGHLAAAAENFWAPRTTSSTQPAPTNDVVAAWLVDRGVSSRRADVMAQLLRADSLPPGPRRK